MKKAFFSGAAFLMATSAVGPGFLNNTSKFTQDLLASFGFVILLSVILDIFAQLNIWQAVIVSGKRAQEIANETLPLSGYALSVMVATGGLAFNIGNVGGAGLGLSVLTGLDVKLCAVISALFATSIFLSKESGKLLDWFVRFFGLLMILLTLYVVWFSKPPLTEAILRTFVPEKVSALAVVALVGGTVGGYISFAGAHRLLDSGVIGKDRLNEVNESAVSGILVTAVIRFLLFLASLGVIVSLGKQLDEKNPAASVFEFAAGEIGHKIFGIVMFSAAITSVIGASYTSISFIKTLFKLNENKAIIFFIAVSTLIFILVGQPAKVLVIVGAINGFILPISLSLILLAIRKNKNDYQHPLWLEIGGWIVTLIMTAFSIYTVIEFTKT
ncbi:MAG: divalent metal cation transporter [Pyrinomonadaceae bacterium]|nr:divalent metal cation transporter [Pyrinomonadaceae bacterium]MCX7638860.1 divalent metal cation transporter [Pyrinomonadaceae bacterium]MDW8305004.1 divalent metal cation transporter [Acidobacteriota bacterium]